MKKHANRRAKQSTRKPNKEKIINAIVLKSREQAQVTCKILEYQEMQAIEQQLAGQLTDKFCYEFDKDGKKIRGIRAVGVREAIRFCGVKPYNFIPQFRYERQDLGEGWFMESVFCTNPITKEVTRSTCQWKRGERFGDRVAGTVAERNAMLKHLPTEIQIKFINYCVKKGFIAKANVDPQLPANKKAFEALPDAKDPGMETTSLITRIYAIGGSMGIKSDKLRIFLHKKYKTESLKSLTHEVLKQIIYKLGEIENNVPGKCAAPKKGIQSPDELKAQIETEIA